MVVVGYCWWCWVNCDCVVSDSPCMSGSCFICRSDLVKFMLCGDNGVGGGSCWW